MIDEIRDELDYQIAIRLVRYWLKKDLFIEDPYWDTMGAKLIDLISQYELEQSEVQDDN